MVKKSYPTIIDINTITLNFITVFTFISGFIVIASNDYTLALCAVLLYPVPLLSYFVCHHTNRKLTFILCHLLMFVAYAFLFRNSLLRSLSLIYILAVTVYNLAVKHNTIHNASLVFASVFFLFSIYCTYYIEDFQFTNFYFLLAVLYILLYLLNMNLINYTKYFKIYEDIHLPVQGIKKTNNKMILTFAILCLLLMCVFSIIPAGEILSYILKPLKQLINYLKPLLQQRKLSETDIPAFFGPDRPQVDSADSWNILFLFPPIIIVVGSFFIYMFVNLIKNYKKSENTNGEVKNTAFVEKREKLATKPLNDTFKNFIKTFSLSNNEKIRKYYYKAVIHNLSTKKITKDMTPSQLSAIVNADQADLLTSYYEKARYSPWECSHEEVQSVKNLLN